MRNCMLAAIIAGVLLTGCVSIEIGPEDSPMRLEWEGLGTAYAAMNGMPEWDGKVASAHLLRGDEGELAAVEIWPVAEVAVGLLGAKIHLLPFEVGTAGSMTMATTMTMTKMMTTKMMTTKMMTTKMMTMMTTDKFRKFDS